MPFSPAFSVIQSPQTPAFVTLSDDSEGSDPAITQRRAYIQDSDGNYLVPSGVSTNYNQWALANTSLTLNLLTQDKAVSVLVQWLDVNDDVLYSETTQFCLAEFNKQFFYYLAQQQALNPGIVQDGNYFANMAMFWASLQGAIKAVQTGDDIDASQEGLDRCTEMQQNETKYF